MSMSYIPALSPNTLSRYIRSVIAIPDIDREEEEQLFTRYKVENCLECGRKLILSHLKLVVNMSYKYRKFRDISDLIQEGNIGLMVALSKFDLAKGVRFATYAAWWIKAKIQEFILSHMSIVRFGKGRAERKLFYNLVDTVKDIELYDYDRELTREEVVNEVAARLSIDPDQVRDGMRALSSYDVSLDASYDESGADRFQLADDTDIENEVIHTEAIDSINGAIDALSDREQYIINNRFLSDQPMKLDEIGQKYGISKERVRQIEERALAKIRETTTALVPAKA